MILTAEIGSCHKQNLGLATLLIKEAKQAGADIAKFQLGWPKEDAMRHIDHMARELWAVCRYYDIEFMASIWSPAGFAVAKELGMRRYKVSHQVAMERPEWMQDILEDRREVFVTLPHESDASLPNVRRIYAQTEYPTPPDKVLLPKAFGLNALWYGYSDHTLGIEACLVSAARGARYIEKHFCLDRSDLYTRDTPLCATPDEFATMARLAKEMWKL